MYVSYDVIISRKATKALRKIGQPMHDKITRALEGPANEPRPSGCVKLEGTSNGYRVRVNNYRIVYTIDDRIRVVDVQDIATRQSIYRK